MILSRTTDRLTCCHVRDEAVIAGELAFDETGWLFAHGQPEGAMRVTVRPLSSLELTEAFAAKAGYEQNASLCRGLCLIDGQPVNADELSHWWHSEIALLVLHASQGPTAGRRSPSTTGQ